MNIRVNSAASKRKTNSSETIYISPLALIKMIKHGRSGVPVEVMGIMLGEFVDDLTIYVTDVFPMPQIGTDTSVETVDEVYQTDYMGLLKQTGRMEGAVGWYHSHPGFGCWLSSVDIETQAIFEGTDSRCVAVVVDPIQSVKGNVVIDAFRLVPGGTMMPEIAPHPMQFTGNRGHVSKSSSLQRNRGCDERYYRLPVRWDIDPTDKDLMVRLSRPQWHDGMVCKSFEAMEDHNLELMDDMFTMMKSLKERVEEETKEDASFVGRVDPNQKLKADAEELLMENLVQGMNATLGEILF